MGTPSFYRGHFVYFRKKVQQLNFPIVKDKLLLMPELDLPSKNSPTYEIWLQAIQKKKMLDQYQIGIISNLLGFIPLELAETYPAGQHACRLRFRLHGHTAPSRPERLTAY